jgi:16S rRNA pseudouridine516 synthase
MTALGKQTMTKMIRLDKLLGHSGEGSRKEIKNLCKSGSVTINGSVCLDPATKVEFEKSVVAVDGKLVFYTPFHYVMLHKPENILSATRDHFSKTVLDLLPSHYKGTGMFPVGRLDKDTTGLLLITNDGDWAHRITSPKKEINKIYETIVAGTISDDINSRFQRGIELTDGFLCQSALAEKIGDCTLRIVIHEGKFHQIKRMCAAVGLTVTSLRRLQIGQLRLDETLHCGEFRILTEEERELPFR